MKVAKSLRPGWSSMDAVSMAWWGGGGGEGGGGEDV